MRVNDYICSRCATTQILGQRCQVCHPRSIPRHLQRHMKKHGIRPATWPRSPDTRRADREPPLYR